MSSLKTLLRASLLGFNQSRIIQNFYLTLLMRTRRKNKSRWATTHSLITLILRRKIQMRDKSEWHNLSLVEAKMPVKYKIII